MTAMGGNRRRAFARGAVAVAALCAWLVIGTSPAGATHERTVGQTWYSDGTTVKTAARGATLTIYATGVPRVSGVDGGVTERYWLVTVGQRYISGDINIPCYQNFRFVDGVPRYQDWRGGTIPNSSFTVPSWLGSGQWEVCFYSQPFEYVTAPVLLNVP